MNMVKKSTLFTLLFVALSFAIVACENEKPHETPNPDDGKEQPVPEPLTESHTLMIIMQGNNGLAEFMDSNLQRIITAYYDVPTDIGRILIFYDRGNYTRLTFWNNESRLPVGILGKQIQKLFLLP